MWEAPVLVSILTTTSGSSTRDSQLVEMVTSTLQLKWARVGREGVLATSCLSMSGRAAPNATLPTSTANSPGSPRLVRSATRASWRVVTVLSLKTAFSKLTTPVYWTHTPMTCSSVVA